MQSDISLLDVEPPLLTDIAEESLSCSIVSQRRPSIIRTKSTDALTRAKSTVTSGFVICISRSTNCLSHRHSLAKDMSLSMPHPERTMSNVNCKVQTVAMSRPSRAETPLCLVGVE